MGMGWMNPNPNSTMLSAPRTNGITTDTQGYFCKRQVIVQKCFQDWILGAEGRSGGNLVILVRFHYSFSNVNEK